MIRGFRHKGLRALFERGNPKGVDPQHAVKLRRMLLLLQAGPLPDAMRLPGFKLHRLKGELKGHWAVWVSGNHRLTFEIEGEDATNTWYGDYH